MKKITLILFLLPTYIFSNINGVVSIVPVQTFVKAIGGEHVTLSIMVNPGDSPHSYEPKPSQMVSVAKADLYFAIGVEFEEVWLPKFSALNQKMSIVNLNKNVKTIQMGVTHEKHDTHQTQEKHKDAHQHTGRDPHIWTSPKNVAIIAQDIFNALSQKDPSNTAYYKQNLEKFLTQIHQTDEKLTALFSKHKASRHFMVFHPSWGYFAHDYGLTQIAVEVEGKSPKPKELVHLIKEAKEEQVSAIFTQPEFSDASAKIIAKELQIPVVKVSPLSPHWSENLLNIAKNIVGEQ